MIEAFFFGPTDHRIFGSYHPPLGGGGQVVTVICPPLFNEYMRTHLALRELAIELSARGQHVLRFDYRGTGDSFDELDQVTISDWLEDIALAVREGRELSGSNVVRLLAVRAGALLACRAARAFGDVQRSVLWDPVPDGAGYFRTLRRIQATIIERDLILRPGERREGLHEFAGYRLSERMVQEFNSLDGSVYTSVSKRNLHVVSTSPATPFPLECASWEVTPFECDWETELEDLITPKLVLERLSACLTMP